MVFVDLGIPGRFRQADRLHRLGLRSELPAGTPASAREHAQHLGAGLLYFVKRVQKNQKEKYSKHI